MYGLQLYFCRYVCHCAFAKDRSQTRTTRVMDQKINDAGSTKIIIDNKKSNNESLGFRILGPMILGFRGFGVEGSGFLRFEGLGVRVEGSE